MIILVKHEQLYACSKSPAAPLSDRRTKCRRMQSQMPGVEVDMRGYVEARGVEPRSLGDAFPDRVHDMATADLTRPEVVGTARRSSVVHACYSAPVAAPAVRVLWACGRRGVHSSSVGGGIDGHDGTGWGLKSRRRDVLGALAG